MKNLTIILGLVVLVSSTSASVAQKSDTSTAARIAAANVSRGNAAAAQNVTQKLSLPPPEAVVVMIRSSILALSHANLTNNYSVLSGLGSVGFRSANSPERLSQLFQPFRANNIDMSPVVFVAPQLTQQPSISDGKLRLIGVFPTAPMRVNYDLSFEAEQGVWKLQGISVNLAAVHSPPAQSQKSR